MAERTKLWTAVFFVFLALGLLALSVRTTKTETSSALTLLPKDQAKPAPDFTLPDAATGRPVSLKAETKTRPVVLDFWATWCGPCRMEMPHLSALADKYKGRVAFYGVNDSDTPARIQAFAAQNDMRYPTLIDAGKRVGDQYGAEAIPLLVIIDRQGKARLLQAGFDPSADFEADVSKALDQILAGE